jgi:glycerophosphodiester phosphodiesterase
VKSAQLPLDDPLHTFRFDVPVATASEGLFVQFDAVGGGGLVLARATLLPSVVLDKGEDRVVLPLLSRDGAAPVGEISVEYVLLRPFPHPIVNSALGKTFALSTRVIGHRGAGAEQNAFSGLYRRSHISENTVLSFVAAAALGAEYVEFDVQLTRDLVPVIYHDFLFKSARSALRVPVANLKFSEFVRENRQHRRTTSSRTPRELAGSVHCVGLGAELRLWEGSLEEEAAKMEMDRVAKPSIVDSFTTLAEAFQLVAETTGFNIEIKYPLEEEMEEDALHFVDRNTYVDKILEVVFEHAGERPLVFSSFDPHVCLMVAMKQPTYPVLFLTEAGEIRFGDPRCNSVREAIRFAVRGELQGIVCNSSPLVEAPELIRTVKNSGLLLCTYGAANNDRDKVLLQKQWGVDSIITDHIAYISQIIKK